MKIHKAKYQFEHHLSREQLSEIRRRILVGDSLVTIAADMDVRHDIVCCAAEQIIKELKSPGYTPEVTEADLYRQELPADWRLPEIKAPKDFKGLKIINTFDDSIDL